MCVCVCACKANMNVIKSAIQQGNGMIDDGPDPAGFGAWRWFETINASRYRDSTTGVPILHKLFRDETNN